MSASRHFRHLLHGRMNHKRWTSTKASNVIKKYGVMITGGPPDHIQQYGDYGDMMVKMLSDQNQANERWFKYYCLNNEFPSNEELRSLNGIVITGSKSDAHGQDEWICNLRTMIQQVYDENKCRILGICFGHQIISNALDGHSGPTQIGWQLGVQHITFNQEFYKIFPSISAETMPILKLHKDQVSKLPSNAILLASSCNTPIEMYSIRDNVLCIQGHPEFDMEYLKKVVECRNKDGIIPDENRNICMESMRDTESFSNITRWSSLLRSWLFET